MGPPPIISVVLSEDEKSRGAFLEIFERKLLAEVTELDSMRR